MKSSRKSKFKISVIVIASILTLGFPNSLNSTDLNKLIKAFCIDGYKKELTKNNHDIDLELGEYICNCLVKRVNKNENLEKARNKCTKEALKKFEYKNL